MKEIVCPNCGKAFTVDDSGYAKLLEEVKTKEFERELEKRVSELESKKKLELELNLEKAKKDKDNELNELRKELNELKSLLKAESKYFQEMGTDPNLDKTDKVLIQEKLNNFSHVIHLIDSLNGDRAFFDMCNISFTTEI